jgi:uncharacterized integral membrane protein
MDNCGRTSKSGQVAQRAPRNNHIALSILAMNLDRILAGSLSQILILIFLIYNQRKNTLRFMQNKHYENLVAC